jgi:hypothetical protein
MISKGGLNCILKRHKSYVIGETKNMNVVCHNVKETQIAEMQSKGIVIRSARDASDIIKQLVATGINRLILHEKNLCPEMWIVTNGLAAAILKEFHDFGVEVAFVGEFTLHKSKGLQALIKENNLGNHANFVATIESAKMKLSHE